MKLLFSLISFAASVTVALFVYAQNNPQSILSFLYVPKVLLEDPLTRGADFSSTTDHISFSTASSTENDIHATTTTDTKKETDSEEKQNEDMEIIATATTTYKGSTKDRVTNITLGVKRISGKIIEPGKSFSLLKALAPFTEESGFKKEFIIGATTTKLEIGGGLCQVATTLFRGALHAGLTVTNRRAHSYISGYYGAGLDSTIYDPTQDFTFINNYQTPIRLEGSVKNNIVEINVYGKKDGRQVTIGTPIKKNIIEKPDTIYVVTTEIPLGEIKCTETARRGMDTETKYSIAYKDGTTTEKTFYSHYKPWPALCSVGTTADQVEKIKHSTTTKEMLRERMLAE